MRESFLPIYPYHITDEENTLAPEHLMFLKENRDFSIKARGCVDGRTQWEGPNKIYETSPMVSLEAILIMSCIYAAKKRDVAVVDIPAALLTADMDDILHMVLRVRLA